MYLPKLHGLKLSSSPVIPRTKANIENSSALSPMLCTPSDPWTFVRVRYRSMASCSSSAIYCPWLSFIAAVVQRGLTPAHAGDFDPRGLRGHPRVSYRTGICWQKDILREDTGAGGSHVSGRAGDRHSPRRAYRRISRHGYLDHQGGGARDVVIIVEP